jgi:hypothetical protein
VAREKPSVSRPVILQISDTQFGRDHAFSSTDPRSTQSLFTQLKRGIEKGFESYDLPHPNIIVISGDIANWAQPSEYESAKEFIEALCGFLRIDTQNVVLVPGNHDVNFGLSRGAFLQATGEGTYALGEDLRDPEIYPFRSIPFERFFEAVQGIRKYSLDPERMYSIYEFQDRGLLVVGFNSCDEIDHRMDIRRRQGYIREQAIENARRQIGEIEKKCRTPYKLIVAVWHHNPFPVAGATDFLTNGDKVAEILGSKCRLALYGHVHQFNHAQIMPGISPAFGIQCIGAGTIGVKEELRGGTTGGGHFPLSFNVIELDLDSHPNKGRLHTFYAVPSGGDRSSTFLWQPLLWNGARWRDFELG